MSEQEKFEQWALQNNFCSEDDLKKAEHSDRYANYLINCSFIAWTARANMEQAA